MNRQKERDSKYVGPTGLLGRLSEFIKALKTGVPVIAAAKVALLDEINSTPDL